MSDVADLRNLEDPVDALEICTGDKRLSPRGSFIVQMRSRSVYQSPRLPFFDDGHSSRCDNYNCIIHSLSNRDLFWMRKKKEKIFK